MRRRLLLTSVLAMGLMAALASPVGAESQTVDGQNAIKKMFASNGDNAVTAKLWGLEKPCGGAWWFRIQVRWGESKAYELQVNCTSGTWYGGMVYMSDRSDPQTAKIVECEGAKFSYNKDKKFHKGVMPRSCMPKAANKIRVVSRGMNYGDMKEGKAGPTKLLAKG